MTIEHIWTTTGENGDMWFYIVEGEDGSCHGELLVDPHDEPESMIITMSAEALRATVALLQR